MDAVVAFGMGRSMRVARRWCRGAIALVACLAVIHAWAQDEAGNATALAQAEATPSPDTKSMRPQLEVSASSLPRFDNTDGATHTDRLDMTWLPPRRTSLGLSLGMTTPNGSAIPMAGPLGGGAGTSVDVGLRWRHTFDSHYRVDLSAWRRMGQPDALSLVHSREPSYGARVEMRIGKAPIKNGFVADRGFLGFQLESGARITLKRSGGKPMIYYRTRF